MRHSAPVNWMVYAAGAAVALAAADIFVKLAAGKVSTSMGVLLYGVVPLIAGVLWALLDMQRGGHPPFQWRGVIFALAVGVTFTLVTVGLYAAFRAGAPLSLASPLIRVGGLLIASIVGLILWKEPFTARYIIGLSLACGGIYLMITR